MPGRYGKPAKAGRRAHAATPRRPSFRLRLIGVVTGGAIVATGVVAITGAADNADNPEFTPESFASGGGEMTIDRDPGGLSRSGSRQPGRLLGTLSDIIDRAELSDDAEADDADDTTAEEPDDSGEPDDVDEVDDDADDELDEDGSTDEPDPDPNAKPEATAPLPDNSGEGKRVVFDITGQQVWLVAEDGDVERTYMVSGSRYDQLPEGTYQVFSKSEDAISWTLEETMRYMVRFHRGENSNIGFHDIPVYKDSGDAAQTLSELGTPLSDGCIRQDLDDAKALWEFAPVGTDVVVVRT
ncbi:L,D-transpeptidase [Phytoactinopolyspora limicola]|uniref:L,D-transpeptidase n=1 Tax=Phytoactinopolyspora limicola TaxID=2715536 RepID=UPI00140B1EB9|nr:L,D-transpeptidase [Phytoactinopolyspora limicola]